MYTREDLERKIFEQFTQCECCEADPCNFVNDDAPKYIYELHGDEETGRIFGTADYNTPDNVLFTSTYSTEDDPADVEIYDWESKYNERFMELIKEFADKWERKYRKLNEN